MIVRVFRARVYPDKHAEYERLVQERAIPLMQAEEGMLGLRIGLPMEPTPNEYVIITRWRDLDAMTHFTGDNWHEPVILDDAADLIEEATVSHYEQLPIAGQELS